MEKRLFRREHPVLTAFLVVGGTMFLILFGITFFISMVIHSMSGDFLPDRDGVGVIQLKGVIVSSDEVIQELVDFRKNEHVKAIVLRIDSPGGTVGAAQEIYEEVKRTNEVKPVVASMASLGASGGYYVALGARRIMANPGTLTGSMGVILKLANLEELFKKIGYKVEVIKSGELKDIGSSNRPLTREERDILQKLMDNVHEQFIAAIVTGRVLPEAKVRMLADGRLFTGQEAKELGLIDELGNLTSAVRQAAKLGGLEEIDPHLIYPEKKDFSLLGILSGKSNQALSSIIGESRPGITYEWPMFQ